MYQKIEYSSQNEIRYVYTDQIIHFFYKMIAKLPHIGDFYATFVT